MSSLGQIYQRAYEALCGRHPDLLPWHFQWLFLRKVHVWQRGHMKDFHGRVLDVGCGDKPYANRVDKDKVTDYVGLDVTDQADITVEPGQAWPLDDESFDCILFTQVLEHLGDRDQVIGEMTRVLKPGGVILLTVPFLFPVHGFPYDYARFTRQGVVALFERDYEIGETATPGGIGTTLVSLWLTWIDGLLNLNMPTRMVKGLILPVWIPISFVSNMIGLMLDWIDVTNTHYGNVCALLIKKS